MRRHRILLLEVRGLEEVIDKRLREFACVAGRGEFTRYYKARNERREVAIVGVDFRDDLKSLVIITFFVPVELRRKGFGTCVLKQVEKLAVKLGYPKVRLCPRPLDEGITDAELVAWYKKREYCETLDNPDELEKRLNAT